MGKFWDTGSLQGPCSGPHVSAPLQCGLATCLPGRDVSFTLFNHLLLSILRRAKAPLVDTCHRPCTEAPGAHETRDNGCQKKAAQHRTAQPAAGDLLETTHLLQPQLPSLVSYTCRRGILPAEMHGHIKWSTVHFLKETEKKPSLIHREKEKQLGCNFISRCLLCHHFMFL